MIRTTLEKLARRRFRSSAPEDISAATYTAARFFYRAMLAAHHLGLERLARFCSDRFWACPSPARIAAVTPRDDQEGGE